MRWRIRPVLPVTKGLAAVAVLVLVFAFGRDDPVQWAMAVAVAIGLAGWALRDLVAPVRLAADPDGITVVEGFARRRRLSWAQVERVRIDRQERLGLTTELLEVDAGEALYLFSQHDLGTDPHEVLPVLAEFRARHDDDAQESTDTAW